ncbi:HEXXH motif domain-containing protein [Streptomyces caelestis]|uniref:HEXXH motif-containing protein n=1 Tax=Streptomyces caelestis TaxID=36816 RepID=A0A7W9HA15_9ACTN|nr:HEXXH motif domain-containing protein [Streptomyces caelestis]MBB5798114.1 HEXXH motif-containing protein [Streptomyces caelestis]GGW65842.1 HEXXH motif domain-containing protein [Streptomyces caelestis]
MPSEPRPVPFRMPERIFAELAAGGGSAQAVAFLERAERARRLLLLRTLLDRLDTLRTPLSPAAEAWDVLKEAAALAPGPVDRLLLAPATGGWLAHLLRRLHGTASGPPLWAEAGYLCALALAASVRAGTQADLRVPLTDGGLSLPGLGRARLADAEGGSTVGRARTSGGELTLSGPARDGGTVSVTVRPATRPLPVPAADAPGPGAWIPLLTLTHRTPTGPVAIPLEDLDPYRDLDDPLPPARLDAEEAEAWQRLFEEAVALLAAPGGDGPGRFDPGAIRAVVPWGRTGTLPPAPPTVLVSASSGDSFGAMVIARPSSAVALAETLVHEFQHSKLAALLHLFPLLDDDREERYYAPWRPDPRHLTGLLHGAYAFTGVTGFWRDRLAGARDERAADTAGYHFALRRLQSRLVVRTLLVEGRLTPQGRALVSGLAGTLDGWLREPVPHAALTRARTAAALHRTEWRLRNVAPPSSGHEGPRLRPDRTSWPDVRTHAFAARPLTPHTADEYLAAGNAAAALARYAGQRAADPAEPHALAGWIVARAALGPSRATRRMLARPELLQPLPSG